MIWTRHICIWFRQIALGRDNPHMEYTKRLSSKQCKYLIKQSLNHWNIGLKIHLFSNAFEQCAFHLDNIAKRRHWAIALDTFQVARNIRLNAWNNLQNPNNIQWFRQISSFVVNNVHSSKTFTIEKTMCKCFRQCAECETNNHNPLEQWCKT